VRRHRRHKKSFLFLRLPSRLYTIRRSGPCNPSWAACKMAWDER
jgi:hypothetical protein